MAKESLNLNNPTISVSLNRMEGEVLLKNLAIGILNNIAYKTG